MKYRNIEAKIYQFEQWVNVIDSNELKTFFTIALQQSGFTIIDFIEYEFPVKGYTCVWLLGESHLAIHTFPENHKSYIQISSCNDTKLEKLKTKIVSIAYKK